MAAMTIQLRGKLKTQVAARAAEGGFESIEAYVEWLVRADAGGQSISDADLKELLLRRVAGGPGIPCTPGFVAQFKQQVARRRQSAGKA